MSPEFFNHEPIVLPLEAPRFSPDPILKNTRNQNERRENAKTSEEKWIQQEHSKYKQQIFITLSPLVQAEILPKILTWGSANYANPNWKESFWRWSWYRPPQTLTSSMQWTPDPLRGHTTQQLPSCLFLPFSRGESLLFFPSSIHLQHENQNDERT